MNRRIPLHTDEIYHLYNRGVDKRDIFLEKKDYDRFQFLLYLANGNKPIDLRSLFHERRSFGKNESRDELYKLERGEQLVAIGVYAQMPNHFHILAKQLVDFGISRFMSKLLTSYAKCFNGRHQRSGVLFERRFQSIHADSDKYLRYLYSYIHLNPLKLFDPKWQERGIRNVEKSMYYLSKYQYSSYPDYLGQKRPENAILDPSHFPNYFTNPKSISEEISEWIKIKGNPFV